MAEKLKLLQQGAEAKIFLDKKDNLIIKDRISKSYRIPEIDKRIIKQRTKAETKLLEKASKIINAPLPLPSRDKIATNKIFLPFIEGKKLSEHLNKLPLKKQKEVCREIGKEIAKLHDAGIIHGDLTTSNMILVKEKVALKNNGLTIKSNTPDFLVNNPSAEKSGRADFGAIGNRERSEPIIFFIDFGLGFISPKHEDKAIDIHLFKQALEAKHFQSWEILFEEFERGYKNSEHSKMVLERLKAVEKRGRYRN